MTRSGATSPDRRATLRAATLGGVGLMAGIDQVVFHQLLGWHHFYDRSTPAVGLLSDGLLHAGELVLLVAGGFGFADLRRRGALAARWAWSGLFLGLGGFQVFDGVVDHKVLRVHQVRYGVDLLPYDVAWNGAGAVLLAVGAVLLVRARRSGARTGAGAGPGR